MAQQFLKQNTGPKGSLLRYALRGPGFDPYLSNLSANAAQPAVRAVAFQALLQGRVSWPIGFETKGVDRHYNKSNRVTVFGSGDVGSHPNPDGLMRAGLQDSSWLVRRIAADALIECAGRPDDARALAIKLGSDRNAALRSRGEYLLRKMNAWS